MRRVAIIVVCVLLAGAEAHASAWREGPCHFRRPVDITPGNRSDAATVSFYHGGRAKPDGSDIRVYAEDGTKAAHAILQAGPGDFVRLAFQYDGKPSRYYIYYGNADAKPSTEKWEPKGGLILETRGYRGGDPGSLNGMRDIIKRSEPKFGKGFVKNVFQGLNIFGPHTNYVSIYHGTLYAPSTGKYVMCTSSDDASFMLIDAKLVVSWPGWHGPVADTRYNATVDLDAGPHAFEYLHINGGGGSAAVAAWQHPGMARIAPIGPDAFGWPGTGRAGPVELRGGGGAADFLCEVTAEGNLSEDNYIVKAAFEDTAGEETGTTWDFGDGLEGSGRITEHVYLQEGDYSIKMKNRQGECVNRVQVVHRWWNDMAAPTPLAELARQMKAYDFTRLNAKLVKKALAIFQDIEDATGAEAVMKAIVARPGEVDADSVAESAVTLSRSESFRAPEDALKMLTGLEKPLENSPAALARVLLAEGDVHFYFMQKQDKALELYDRVVSRFAGKVQEHTVRIAKIRIGDVYRERGDYEKALKAYTEGEKLKINPWPEDRLAVRKGGLFMEVENLLKDGKLDDAAESLDTLEWEYPAERLRGESSVLRGRIALGRKNSSEAYKQFMALVKVNPRSEYAAECLYLSALIKEQEGNKDEAAALRKRIVDEYPESPRAAEVTKQK